MTPLSQIEALLKFTKHTPGCSVLLCQFDYGGNRCQQGIDSSDHDATIWPDAHAFIAGTCSCGLDALLASLREAGAEPEYRRVYPAPTARAASVTCSCGFVLTLVGTPAPSGWERIIEELAAVYTVDTDQIALIQLVMKAKELVAKCS